ncbi:hypothetical protein BVRB_8g189630 [Beta vulgaris subsp. vulgaris]|nr:hypothetical protein BVRB_8g189630 [Beta vulgaris subsp. vulgaris]
MNMLSNPNLPPPPLSLHSTPSSHHAVRSLLFPLSSFLSTIMHPTNKNPHNTSPLLSGKERTKNPQTKKRRTKKMKNEETKSENENEVTRSEIGE